MSELNSKEYSHVIIYLLWMFINVYKTSKSLLKHSMIIILEETIDVSCTKYYKVIINLTIKTRAPCIQNRDIPIQALSDLKSRIRILTVCFISFLYFIVTEKPLTYMWNSMNTGNTVKIIIIVDEP